MSPEEAKALKVGDRVLVEAVIVGGCASPGEVALAFVPADGSDDTAYCRHDAIRAILPPELKVGDRVRYKSTPPIGEIRHIVDGWAWVSFTDCNHPMTAALFELEPA